MDVQPDGAPPLSAAQLQREKLIAALVLDELRRARPVRLGVDLPSDKRLLSLCEAVQSDGFLQQSGRAPAPANPAGTGI